MIAHFSSQQEFTEITNLRSVWKQQGLKVGATSGSFDVSVARHALSLEECKKQCDILLVLLNSDSSVKKYKGKNKPINIEGERAYLLTALRSVDHVVLFDDLTPIELLRELQPDIYFNLSEWGEDCVEKQVIDSYGGKLRVFDVALPQGWSSSSTDLAEKITVAQSALSAKAIFIDRDGVINENRDGYVHTWEEFRIFPDVVEALQRLQQSGYKLIIVTNQSGVGRGMYKENDVQILHEHMLNFFKQHGVSIDAIYYCPHHPDDDCTCRKPGVGMLLKAVDEHNINLSKSWLIGDSLTDIEAGRMANAKTVLISSDSVPSESNIKPHYVVGDLKQAADLIVDSGRV